MTHRRTSRWALVALAALSSGCRGVQSALDTHGPAADRLAQLWWWLFGVTGIAASITIVALLWPILFRRPRATNDENSEKRERVFIVVTGAVIPSVILIGLLVFTLRVGAETAEPPTEPEITVDVIGHQFWWEFIYPDHGVVTANELHIPIGKPVRLRLAAADVIHSFWVPALHGKIDTVPGKVNRFWIQADRAGTYRGQCAEFCGVQHALMALLVIAEPPEQFEAWLKHNAQPAIEPTDPVLSRGLEVYREASCNVCHTIRGVTMARESDLIGPDLTHLASRRTLGSATVENNRGQLGGWILNPQAMKPGVRMPQSSLEPEAFHSLLAFLESLN